MTALLKRLEISLVLMGLFLTAACSGIKTDFQQPSQFRLTLSPGAHGPENIGKGDGLLVRLFDVSPEFDFESLTYRVAADRYETDFYNKFMTSPGRMITQVIKEGLYASSHFTSVTANDPENIRYRLRGTVLELYGDAMVKNRPMAVMTIRFKLEKQDQDGFSPVVTKTYSQQIGLETLNAQHLIQAWNQCIEQILTDFLKDTATAVK